MCSTICQFGSQPTRRSSKHAPCIPFIVTPNARHQGAMRRSSIVKKGDSCSWGRDSRGRCSSQRATLILPGLIKREVDVRTWLSEPNNLLVRTCHCLLYLIQREMLDLTHCSVSITFRSSSGVKIETTSRVKRCFLQPAMLILPQD